MEDSFLDNLAVNQAERFYNPNSSPTRITANSLIPHGFLSMMVVTRHSRAGVSQSWQIKSWAQGVGSFRRWQFFLYGPGLDSSF